ncbi:reactive intermediate/imine deaminase [Vreelandella venusta]|uniref:Reactive intermediate/imine deaminase n=1 Tax=Halomonas hydrothermalis TaxID=115561 RepID=A0A6F8U320_9GAMM|nr:RidA family protein [Halomonas hydrothermalis]BCB07229.1 reactive intermediate/imine deaminase [Halomonas hydrothermalis]
MKDLLPRGGHYVGARRTGDLVFTAGQVPRDDTRRIIGTTIEEQTAVVLRNLEATLKSVGAEMSDVIKVTVHLQHLKDVTRFNLEYSKHFIENAPVRTVVGSDLNGVLVEIDAIATIGGGEQEK